MHNWISGKMQGMSAPYVNNECFVMREGEWGVEGDPLGFSRRGNAERYFRGHGSRKEEDD